ncbi:hypothetical protein ACO0LM_13530 [Undibacterium sp. Di26W]|uniref:hypothetical protein n=1 Tax=Undibacterium sp. Di26W TaxID=3413035 RepID=UPI003BF2AEFA
MAHIIAGRLQLQDQVQQAIHQLVAIGFSENEISSFYLNPPGQHDMYKLGGDRDESPGSTEAGTGAVGGATAGGAIGAAVGAIGIPVAGPVSAALGALVGAHVGSLIGGLSQMKEKGEVEDDAENAAAVRHSGMMVAVSVSGPERADEVVAVLRGLGADQIETGEGTITAGNWHDFDPLQPPKFLVPAEQATVEQQAVEQGVTGREL